MPTSLVTGGLAVEEAGISVRVEACVHACDTKINVSCITSVIRYHCPSMSSMLASVSSSAINTSSAPLHSSHSTLAVSYRSAFVHVLAARSHMTLRHMVGISEPVSESFRPRTNLHAEIT